jgi:uncharacterized OB-fold protein
MGVVRYIPKQRIATDRRTEDGGYYEAVCDECGNTFYPKRNNAKYCSNACTVAVHRRNKQVDEALSIAREIMKPKEDPYERLRRIKAKYDQ